MGIFKWIKFGFLDISFKNFSNADCLVMSKFVKVFACLALLKLATGQVH